MNNDLPNDIEDQTVIHQVTDVDLALCLLAVGVPLRKDPPFTATRLANGKVSWVFNFLSKTRDGKTPIGELIKAYTEADKYIAENPNDLFTGALCVVKNRAAISAIASRVKPWLAYRSPAGKSEMLCIEGSKRQMNLERKGWKRCDPFEKAKRKTRQ
jgi:hypothetical protein